MNLTKKEIAQQNLTRVYRIKTSIAVTTVTMITVLLSLISIWNFTGFSLYQKLINTVFAFSCGFIIYVVGRILLKYFDAEFSIYYKLIITIGIIVFISLITFF